MRAPISHDVMNRIVRDYLRISEATHDDLARNIGLDPARLTRFIYRRASLNSDDQLKVWTHITQSLTDPELQYLLAKYPSEFSDLASDRPSPAYHGATSHVLRALGLPPVADRSLRHFIDDCTGAERGHYLVIRSLDRQRLMVGHMRVGAPSGAVAVPRFTTARPLADGGAVIVRGNLFPIDGAVYAIGHSLGRTRLRFSHLIEHRRGDFVDLVGLRLSVVPGGRAPLAYRLYCFQLGRRPRLDVLRTLLGVQEPARLTDKLVALGGSNSFRPSHIPKFLFGTDAHPGLPISIPMTYAG